MTPLRSLDSYTPRFVAPLTADERFVNFNDTRKGTWYVLRHQGAQVVEHTMCSVPLNTGDLGDERSGTVAQERAYHTSPLIERCAKPFDTKRR